MEYQYDPEQGTALPVNRGGRPDVNPDAITPEELEGAIHDRMARGLSNRAARTHKSSAGETNMLAAETKLLELQAQLSRETNPLKIEQMMAKCEALASGLVGGDVVPMEKESAPTKREEVEAWTEAYRNSNPSIDAALQNASEVMGDELLPEFNELLDSEDEEVRVAALRTVEHLHKSPDSFVAAADSTGVSEDTERHIASQYGEEMAHAISVLGNGVASGAITSKQALQTASKDSRMLSVLIQLASDPSNNFRIAL